MLFFLHYTQVFQRNLLKNKSCFTNKLLHVILLMKNLHFIMHLKKIKFHPRNGSDYRHWLGYIPCHSAWPLLTSLRLLYWRGLERNGIWFLSRMFRDSIILYTACLIHYIWIEIYNYLKIASGHRKWITINPWKMCAI